MLPHIDRPAKRQQELQEVWLNNSGRLHVLQDLKQPAEARYVQGLLEIALSLLTLPLFLSPQILCHQNGFDK